MSKFVFLCLFLSVSAFADPKVGDIASYATKVTTTSGSADGTISFELLAVDASNIWTRKTTAVFSGEKNEKVESVPADQLINDATANSVLASCAQYGGAVETVVVPAGSFASCGLPVNDGKGTVWVTPGIPFEIAKFNIVGDDGSLTYGELQSFAAGK